MTLSVARAIGARFGDHVVPAKNGIPNQETTTSRLGTTAVRWADSCRQMTAQTKDLRTRRV